MELKTFTWFRKEWQQAKHTNILEKHNEKMDKPLTGRSPYPIHIGSIIHSPMQTEMFHVDLIVWLFCMFWSNTFIQINP